MENQNQMYSTRNQNNKISRSDRRKDEDGTLFREARKRRRRRRDLNLGDCVCGKIERKPR